MKRREFLKAGVVGAGVVLCPKNLLPKPSNVHRRVIKDFEVNITNRTIRYVGAKGKKYTVREFYMSLMDLFDDIDLITEPVPAVRLTPCMIELVEGYTIDDETAKYLGDGSVMQGRGDVCEIYSCFGSVDCAIDFHKTCFKECS